MHHDLSQVKILQRFSSCSKHLHFIPTLLNPLYHSYHQWFHLLYYPPQIHLTTTNSSPHEPCSYYSYSPFMMLSRHHYYQVYSTLYPKSKQNHLASPPRDFMPEYPDLPFESSHPYCSLTQKIKMPSICLLNTPHLK